MTEPKYQPLAGKVEDLAVKIQALITEAMNAGFREGVAYSAEFLDTLATGPDTPDPLRPVYEKVRDALRLGLLNIPDPAEATDG